MYFTDKTDFLAHYGVIGMKWGVRKYKDKNAKYNGISINKMATLRSVKTKRDWGITLVSAAIASNPYGGVAIDSYTSTIGTKYKAAKKPK